MIYDGVINKPSLDELYHEKAHKYVERYKNSKGKWVYKYGNIMKKFGKEEKKIREELRSKKEAKGPLYPMNPTERRTIKLVKKSLETTAKAYEGIQKIKKRSKYGKQMGGKKRG